MDPPREEWQPGEVAPVAKHHVEHDVDRWRRDHTEIRFTKPIEARPELLSNTATSPSSTSVPADSLRVAVAMSAKRLVWSRPFRLIRRTRSRSLYASIRQPSTFSSYTQPVAVEGRADGRRGHQGVLVSLSGLQRPDGQSLLKERQHLIRHANVAI